MVAASKLLRIDQQALWCFSSMMIDDGRRTNQPTLLRTQRWKQPSPRSDQL
jgi:hypothetical protein